MKLKKLIACVLAAILLCTLMMVPASAESSRREEQQKKFENMQHSSVHVTITCDGGYYQKSSKLYVRKVTGVDQDGNFILSGWEKVYDRSDVPFNDTYTVILPGTSVCFAYSFDVRIGTDFPYSGVFWNKPDVQVSNITIAADGLVRTPSIKITVDGTTVVNESNCSAHSEWTP